MSTNTPTCNSAAYVISELPMAIFRGCAATFNLMTDGTLRRIGWIRTLHIASTVWRFHILSCFYGPFRAVWIEEVPEEGPKANSL